MGRCASQGRLQNVSMRGASDRCRCQHCGDVIGVYEPMVVRGPSGATRTSLAAQPELVRTEMACFHQACYQVEIDWSREG